MLEKERGRAAVDIVLLAAGRSSRMEGHHKLLATFAGVPLVRRSALTALASRARRVQVVVGHRRDEVVAALGGLDLAIVENERFADGLSTSLLAGLAASSLSPGGEGILVMLADQPFLTSGDLDRLIDAFRPAGLGSIVVATACGRRANPVVLSMLYRAEINRLEGDAGARTIIKTHRDLVRTVELGLRATQDVDTPEALIEAGGELAG